MKSSWDRRCGKGQHINILLHVLYLFLVVYAKPLFLIYNQKPQVVEFHVLCQQTVGADYHIYLTVFKLVLDLPALRRSSEP